MTIGSKPNKVNDLSLKTYLLMTALYLHSFEDHLSRSTYSLQGFDSLHEGEANGKDRTSRDLGKRPVGG